MKKTSKVIIKKLTSTSVKSDLKKTECNSRNNKGSIIRTESHSSPMKFIEEAKKFPNEVCLNCLSRAKILFPNKF